MAGGCLGELRAVVFVQRKTESFPGKTASLVIAISMAQISNESGNLVAIFAEPKSYQKKYKSK